MRIYFSVFAAQTRRRVNRFQEKNIHTSHMLTNLLKKLTAERKSGKTARTSNAGSKDSAWPAQRATSHSVQQQMKNCKRAPIGQPASLSAIASIVQSGNRLLIFEGETVSVTSTGWIWPPTEKRPSRVENVPKAPKYLTTGMAQPTAVPLITGTPNEKSSKTAKTSNAGPHGQLSVQPATLFSSK